LADPATHSAPPADASQRLQATDVRHSVIVQAPAGSGKTTLLVERFLNLLAIVDRPEEVLAITFTRKSAAEMRTRILATLNSDDERARTIRMRGHALNWRLDEQPTRLRIQTIDSLAAGLVQRLPVTSGIGTELRVVEDPEELYRHAIDRVFQRLDSDDPMCAELINLLGYFDNDFGAARAALSNMLSRRDQWLEVAMLALRAGRSNTEGPNEAELSRSSALASAIAAGVSALQHSVFDDIKASLSPAQRHELATCAAVAAANLAQPWQWDELPDDLRGWRFIADLTTTKSGTARKQLGNAQGLTKGISDRQLPKARLKNLIVMLAEAGVIERLAAVRELPRQDFQVDSVHALLTIATGLALSVVELNTLFHRERQLDFTELTYAAQRALGDALAPTDLALALDYRIKHLLVDEFQDTSALQYRLLERLLQGWEPDDTRTLFAVGDPMQSIYRFRDADVALFQRARQHGFGPVKLQPVHLTSNFRASSALVEWCNRVFGPSFGASEDPILGRVAFVSSTPTVNVRPDDGCRYYFVSSTGEANDEAARLADVVTDLRSDHPEESIAILVQNRNQLEFILPALSARKIPWLGTDIQSLAEKPVIDDLLSLLKALLSDTDRLSWLAVLRSPLVGLTLQDLEAIAGREKMAESIRGGVDDDLTRSGHRRLSRVRPILQHSHRYRGQLRTRQWLENAFIDLGGADAYQDPEALSHADRFFALLESDHAWTVRIRSLERSVKRLFAQTPPRRDSVTVMTIHRAKGLEFDHVLLPALHRANRIDSSPVILWRAQGSNLLLGVVGADSAGSIHGWLRREERHRERNELIRLLYVAATRARFSLHLFATLEPGETGPRDPAPQSLLAQIWPAIANEAEFVHVKSSSFITTETRNRLVLPDDYSWIPPAYPDVAQTHVDASNVIDAVDTIGARAEVATGIIIHRELAALTQRSLPAAPITYAASRRGNWRRQLESLGVKRAELDAATGEIARQVSGILADTNGRWMLEPHRDSATETGLTGIEDKALTRVVVDRTFVDASGIRWVIDFKSSRPGVGTTTADFVSDQRARHAAQLRRYKRLFADLEDKPVRVAIYLTALPLLVELDGDLDF
jgi:ATP-dependent helicase/nuclease subunit A